MNSRAVLGVDRQTGRAFTRGDRVVGDRFHRLQVDGHELAFVFEVGEGHAFAVGGQKLGLAAEVDRVGLGGFRIGPRVEHRHHARVTAGGENLVCAGVINFSVGVIRGSHVAEHLAGLQIANDNRAGAAIGDKAVTHRRHGDEAVRALQSLHVEHDLPGGEIDRLGMVRAREVQPMRRRLDRGVIPTALPADVHRRLHGVAGTGWFIGLHQRRKRGGHGDDGQRQRAIQLHKSFG